MEHKEIQQLIDSYFDGTTTLREEQRLREYFRSGSVDKAFKPYQTLFGWYDQQKETFCPPEVTIPHRKQPVFKTAWGIAAGIIVVLGVVLWGISENTSSSSPAYNQVAVQNTQDLLQMTAQLLDEGQEQLQYLTKIQETKNQLINLKP